MLGFGMFLESQHRSSQWSSITAQPPLINFLDRNRVQMISAHPSVVADDHQLRFFKPRKCFITAKRLSSENRSQRSPVVFGFSLSRSRILRLPRLPPPLLISLPIRAGSQAWPRKTLIEYCVFITFRVSYFIQELSLPFNHHSWSLLQSQKTLW